MSFHVPTVDAMYWGDVGTAERKRATAPQSVDALGSVGFVHSSTHCVSGVVISEMATALDDHFGLSLDGEQRVGLAPVGGGTRDRGLSQPALVRILSQSTR